MSVNVSRRKFLISGTGAAFMLSTQLPFSALVNAAHHKTYKTEDQWEANAFITIEPSGKVIITIKHIEFGQGTFTGLATLAAEELDAAWEQVECVHAPADATRYANLNWGPVQGTGGSSAIANAYMQMREAGATAKAMLLSAAAQLWSVPVDELSVEAGKVKHTKSGKETGFGALVGLATQQVVPASVTLKKPEQFTLIGKTIPRKDTGKIDGSAIFTQDIQLPGQLTAVVAHPPKFGATLKSFNDKQAKKVKGVVAVIRLQNGVAVLANSFWQAKTARDKLEIQWDESGAYTKSSDELMREYAALADKPGLVASNVGDVDEAFAAADQIIEANYEFPFLAHATMEPMNCVVQLHTVANNKKLIEKAEFWYGAQLHTTDQATVAKFLGIPPGNVEIHTLFAGGSFGRRGSSHADYVIEATDIAQRYGALTGKSLPIKLVWTREDDMQSGYYRPAYFHKLKAGVDAQGKLIAWQHRVVGQSVMAGTSVAHIIRDGIDPTSVEGARHLPYDIPNTRVELHTTEQPVPVLWWRGVGSTHTAHAIESFVDDIAHAIGQDPYHFRMSIIGKDERHKNVLKLAAEKAGWTDKNQSKNTYKGIALHKSFGTYVAQVVEVSKSDAGIKLEKVTCAVDCGVAVNPDIIKAQMEGGIGYGLSPAMLSEITFVQGKVAQNNFHNYDVLRLKDMPEIDVHIVPSAEPPKGVGEPGTPVVAPALGNALAAAGVKSRVMPMKATFV